MQPIVAAVAAWFLFAEGMGMRQAIGAVAVLAGIVICKARDGAAVSGMEERRTRTKDVLQ